MPYMKTSLLTIRIAFGLFAVILMATPSTQASYFTNYGNFAGTTVNFLGVSESSVTESIPLYHDPIVAGNTLDFNPQNFGAFASGAGGIDLTDGQLSLKMLATNGYAIPTIHFWEVGDFTLAGSGTANTWVDVSARYYINITKVDGVGITPINITNSMVFSPVGSGTFTLPSNPGPLQAWGGSIVFDINNALTLAGVPYLLGATEVQFGLDNSLLALSEAGTVAFIAKKDFQGSVGISVIVPEPTIFALTLCGAGLLISRRKY
jgi:hypothetical protein